MKVAGAYWRGDSQRTVAAHLRHGLGQEGRPRRLPAHARRGRKARPPQARQAARPVPHAGRSAGHGVLAPQGLGRVAGDRAVHARASIATTATRKCAARRSSTARCGKVRPLGELQGQHVHHESENRDYAVKPMNCPGHVQVFNTACVPTATCRCATANSAPAIATSLGRAARPDARARLHVQDDGHIFCTEDQIQSEVTAFNACWCARSMPISASTMSPSSWRCARKARRFRRGLGQGRRCAARGAARFRSEWEELPGEGAFYGPKIEFHIKDAIGRSWQCGTMQVDFSMPQRLGAEYVAARTTPARCR
jgi:hypothetical protein